MPELGRADGTQWQLRREEVRQTREVIYKARVPTSWCQLGPRMPPKAPPTPPPPPQGPTRPHPPWLSSAGTV